MVRVLSRVFAIKEIFKDGASAQKKIRPLAQSLIYSSKPGDYNQAMMELGAMICHRSNPLCSICPIFTYCKSGKTDSWTKYPAIAAKPKRSTLIQRYWVEAEGQLLLHASSKNRLQGIFELPQELPVHSDISKSKTKILAIRKRTIGNVLYTEQILKIGIASYFKNSLPQGYAWVKWSEIEAVTLSGPHRRWIKEIKKIND